MGRTAHPELATTMTAERSRFGMPCPELRRNALRQRRTLTEVEHLYAALDSEGNVPAAILEDVGMNLQTYVSEMAMPYAVTTTLHRVEKHYNRLRRRDEQVITWLGKNAVEVALNGRRFHHHPAALERVDVEVAEARHAEQALRPGKAQIFISPRMSEHDAPRYIAEQEHLADDDSIRVSKATTGPAGEVAARQLQSLLVRDIPLASWYAWLASDANLFGRNFDFSPTERLSALPIMKLFAELEVAEAAVPEGPVSVIADVLPFVRDANLRQSIETQLRRFRGDQELYREQAKYTAERWLEFDLELARSLQRNQATPDIQAFIISMQDRWNRQDLKVIQRHQGRNASFRMTRDLAEILERSNKNLLASQAAITTGNEAVIEQTDSTTVAHIRQQAQTIRQLYQSGASRSDIMALNAELNRGIAAQNFKVKGGCAGGSEGEFKDGESIIGRIIDKTLGLADKFKTEFERRVGRLKKGKCVVDSCPSRPREVTVGGCGVCIERCQKMFDKGDDPTRHNKPAHKPAYKTSDAIGGLIALNGRGEKRLTTDKQALNKQPQKPLPQPVLARV